MQPLEPGQHAVGIVAYKARIDAISVQNGLRYVRVDFVGKRPDDRCQLLQGPSRVVRTC